MRKPDVGPLGLTRGDARARAMVAASRVNRPGGGAVETVVTVATQRRRRPCRARRRDRVRRGRLSILVLSPGSLDQRPSRWPRRARPHPAEPWLRGAREVSEGQRCPTEAPEGHWLWPALPDRHPQPELRAAYGPPSVSAPVLALTGAGAGPVPGLQAVRRLDSDATPGAPSPACRRTGTRVAPPGLERAGPDALDEHADVLPVSRAMKNFEAARQFELMADLLEIRGDNPVRIRAYRRAALNPRVSPGPPGRAAAPRRAWGCPRGSPLSHQSLRWARHSRRTLAGVVAALGETFPKPGLLWNQRSSPLAPHNSSGSRSAKRAPRIRPEPEVTGHVNSHALEKTLRLAPGWGRHVEHLAYDHLARVVSTGDAAAGSGAHPFSVNDDSVPSCLQVRGGPRICGAVPGSGRRSCHGNRLLYAGLRMCHRGSRSQGADPRCRPESPA